MKDIRRFVNELERRVIEADAEIAALSSEKCDISQRFEQLAKCAESERARHGLEVRAVVGEGGKYENI